MKIDPALRLLVVRITAFGVKDCPDDPVTTCDIHCVSSIPCMRKSALLMAISVLNRSRELAINEWTFTWLGTPDGSRIRFNTTHVLLPSNAVPAL